MAGIDSLKDRILKDDSDRAVKIVEDANNAANTVIESAKEKSKSIIDDIKVKSEKDGRDKKDRMIARAQLDARNIILAAKQDAIDNVFLAALKKIQDMDNNEYSKLIEDMIVNNSESGNEEVIFSKKDILRVGPDLIDRVNKRLSAIGRTGQLTVKEGNQTASSGFIMKKGELEINCSIEAQIRMQRDSLEGEIAELLFNA